MAQQTIGFIGLGIMGRPMAEKSHQGGYPLVVHSRSAGPSTTSSNRAPGPRHAQGRRGQCDVLITMLPNSPEVEQVALGKDGIVEGRQAGLIFIDMSTISPSSARRSARPSPPGRQMLDAPVSGGEKGAIDAALSIMIGATRRRSTPCCRSQAMGRRSRCSAPRLRRLHQARHQIIVAVNLTALAEALTLGKRPARPRAAA